MELRADEPRMAGQFEDFDQRIVGRSARENDANEFEILAQVVVDLIAVAVTFVDFALAIDAAHV